MTDREDVTVLLTGAGAPGASGIIRSLRSVEERSVRLVGVDMDPDAYGFELVDESETVPSGGDDDYVPAMAAVAERVGADVVLPLTTAELQPLARQREAFDATVMVSEREALGVANDKGRLYDFLDRQGFAAAPAFRTVDSMADFVSACHELGYPDRPVCFKRPVASGMRGFRVLEPETDRLESLLTEKPTSAVTTLEEVRPVLAEADEFPALVVMEYLPGEEYSVDVLALGRETGPIVPRSRAETRAGITFKGTVEPRRDLITAADRIARQLGLEYNVNIQFKYDSEGTAKVIEINPRVAGTIVMCVGAGVNLPYLAVKYALGESLPDPDIEWGTEMVRYWQELFRPPEGDSYRVPEARLGGR